MHKFDLKDKKILYELDKDSRISLSDLAKKIKSSKEVVFHRINNLRNKNLIAQFHAIIANYRFGLMLYKTYLKFSDISDEEQNEILSYLRAHKDVMYIANSRGRWDLIFGIWASNPESFFSANNAVINQISRYIQEKELSISMKTIQFNRRYLYYDKLSPKEFTFGEGQPIAQIDEEDNKILDILTTNAREKISNISKKTKISRDMVRYRIKRMEKEKVITGYKCLFNSEKLGFVTCKSFIFFKNINEKRKNALFEYCKLLPNVINIVVTFAPWDMEIMFEVESYEKFYKIMDKLRNEFRDIIRFYEGILIYQEPKQVFIKKT